MPDDSPHGRRTSIIDVAAHAGVSRQTVSNVLHDRRTNVSSDTYDRVLAAIAELGYQPNRAAQNLRTRRSMQIGYHLSGEHLRVVNGFFAQFLHALIRQAARDRYQVVVFTHQDDPLRTFTDLVAQRTIDAFVLSESAVDDPRARLLADRGIPFACMGRLAADLPQQWVDVDNAAGMRDLIDHLVARGHRSFAYAGADGGEYWKTERLDGAVAGLAAHGLRLAGRDVFHGDDAGIRRFARRVLTRTRVPDVIVCGSDAVAAVVVNVAHALGRRVGADVAVTGFDGGAVGMFMEPVLTSVHIPLEEIAHELVQRCRREIETGPTGAPGLILPTRVVEGASAGPVRR
ncbi:LacI family DNA-binding transcriptional regulator [Actinoplanes sichuanensis]|uniref:LacI family DNA-binding transcriptional regulator n=1 Tax=Actinoplanes sichuanensis TaxID=512349 RepID=A0ABW4AN41_9ACTN|nr:LacI family DNA-binding transcriptional regulator [Actinoplanes sichuanensis]BEL06746.1 LacI family DNA-binding transcriptional regulator [Actinoplanes sichuanensis]